MRWPGSRPPSRPAGRCRRPGARHPARARRLPAFLRRKAQRLPALLRRKAQRLPALLRRKAQRLPALRSPDDWCRGFGDQTDTGAAAGVSYAPPPLATVTAPCAGRILFAGPFRSYGQMLILDCGRDYRFVLAGLDRLDVAVGQSVARGAAIGRMPGWAGAASGSGRPSLYVQLRHGDATIDPARFLRPSR